MKGKIETYLQEVFEQYPKTYKVLELKEELLANGQERYEDLVREGFSEQDAYENVIYSFGDIAELLEGLEETEETRQNAQAKEKHKRALVCGIAAGLYVFAGAVCVAFGVVDDIVAGSIDFSMVGFSVTVFICIIPTAMLVYASYRYPQYKKEEDTMVEEFKEWKSGSKRKKEIKGSINTLIWLFIVIIYFFLSFMTYAWHLTWLLFLIGACLQVAVNLIFNIKEN